MCFLVDQEKIPSMNKIAQKISKILFVAKVVFYYNTGGSLGDQQNSLLLQVVEIQCK